MINKLFSYLNFLPFRLVINHFKEYLFLTFGWVFIIMLAFGFVGVNYGIPILFLNPEYLGVVGYFSFQLVGICFGGFYITWNIISYLLYSYRFPFMASLKWPVAMFTFNNSIIPLVFIVVYTLKIINYQHTEMGKDNFQIFLMILGLYSGFLLTLLITSIYFLASNKNIEDFISNNDVIINEENEIDKGYWTDLSGTEKVQVVNYYITRKFKIRHIRDVTHYSKELLRKVYQQHHLHAFIMIFFNILVILVLGFMVEKPFFELPAAGGIFMFVSVLMSLIGLVYFWSGRWGAMTVLLVIIGLNISTGLNWMQIDTHAYGLNYSTTKDYSLESLKNICTPGLIENDRKETLEILNNWLKKVKQKKPLYYKPKMFIVLSSGGGTRAATFTMKVMQTLDSLSAQKISEHTVLMSGASGGIMGLAYYRELYLRNKIKIVKDLYNEEYAHNISKDLINKIVTTFVTNDLFFGFKKYTYDGMKYTFDRGSSFEIGLNKFTDGVLNKPISAYKNFEESALIPMMFISGINVNDSRKMIISPQAISYMMHAYSRNDVEDAENYEIDAIDFCAFFKENNGSNIATTSAIRMNATYPLILPNTSLPCHPKIDVFDAGMRDNYGIENAVRFIHVFEDWITENTSGVVLVQIRDSPKNNEIEPVEPHSFISNITSTVSNPIGSLTKKQDYQHDYMIQGIDDFLDGRIEIVSFEYNPDKQAKKASMSLRLSEKEYEQVIQTAINKQNSKSYQRVLELLKN